MSRKRGQHFLTDTDVLLGIQSVILRLKKQGSFESIFEIGPGKGALTTYILDYFSDIVLFEVDVSLKPVLEFLIGNRKGIKISWGDVLKQDLTPLQEKITSSLIVGNLPYYITSPILRTFFVQYTGSAGVFLIQKEVGEKIHSGAKKKSYLWWLLNYEHNVSYEFTVPASAFLPPPKVESAVISIVSKKKESIPNFSRDVLMSFLNEVSLYKRKTLGKIRKMKELHRSLPPELSGLRLEELGWSDMTKILNG